MKKKVFSQVFMLLAVTFIFSSCLGDVENKVEVGVDYVCVVSNDYGLKYGYAGQVGFVSSPTFESKQEGTILLMGYKIVGTQTSNTPTLSETNVVKEFKLADQMQLDWGSAPTEIDNEIYPESMSKTQYWSPYNVFLDRWLLKATFDMAEGTKTKATFYYDSERQEETNNRLILDVRFQKVNELTGDPVNVEQEFVANFNGIRSYIQNMPNFEASNSEAGTPVYVKFRYRKSDPTKQSGYEEITLGSFSSSDIQFILSN